MNARNRFNGQLEPTEHQQQVTYFQWVKLKALEDRRYENIVAIPNAGKRSKGALNYYYQEGLSPGFPDIAILWPSSGYHGMFIELKRNQKSKTSKNQDAWLKRLTAAGYCTRVCYGADSAMEMTALYFKSH